MPRKTKEVEEKDSVKNVVSKSTTKGKVAKSGTSAKVAKVATTKKEKSTTSKKNSVKATKTANVKSTNSKTVKTKNSKTPKAKTTKTSKAKPTKAKNKKADLVSVMEYYDLPYRYNQTIVKILAQTPNILFIYWDIADKDRKAFEDNYGNDFFSKTKPVLIVHNETMNYSFEIEINDFANSWYLHVNDANCKYVIELGRRPFSHINTINEDYIYISSSNEMDSPNNHILFEEFNTNVTYKNTKTGRTSKKDFSSITNYKSMQEIYNIYDLYKTIFKDELFGEITSNDLKNPSSMSSSSFK